MLTTSRLLPARSPTLPDVEVMVTALDVIGAVKSLATMLFCADNTIEFGPVREAPSDRPPVVAVNETSVPEMFAPTEDEIAPEDNKLNVAPALEDPAILVFAPVF